MRVHLAAEHPLEFELADLAFDRAKVAFDLARRRLVILGFGEFKEFDGVADGTGGAVDCFDFSGELGTLAAEFLGLVGFLPDRGVFEFAADFFEPLFLQVVLKETPLRN